MKSFFWLLAASLWFQGCISVKAGAWHKNIANRETKSYEVGVDTANWIPGDHQAGNIAVT